MAICRRRRVEVVCSVADRIVVIIVLNDDDGKGDTMKSIVAYRKSLKR